MDLDGLMSQYAQRDTLVQEGFDLRIRKPDQEVLATSLHQINLERMSINGRPNFRIMVALLAQHDRNDVNVIMNVIKASMRAVVRNPKYYVHRFKRLVAASRLIRHMWMASRFRFAMKIQKLVKKWEKDEETARKEQLQGRKGPRRRSVTSGEPVQDFLTVQAPTDLKRRVFLSEYKKNLDTFLHKWNGWRKQKRAHDLKVRDAHRMHPSRRDAVLADLAPVPPEPEQKWFQHLNALTPQQRFQISMNLQRALEVNNLAQKMEGKEGDRGAMNKYIEEHGNKDDDAWVANSIAAISGFVQQVENRDTSDLVQHIPKDRYAHITSKLFSNADEDDRQKGLDDKKKDRAGLILRGSLEELKASLPTLSKLKGDPWHMPPRPLKGNFVKRNALQKHCNPPTLMELDPMAQSLAVRGVTHAPKSTLLTKTKQSKRDNNMQKVEQEVRNLPATFCPPKEMLRSRRALQITLGVKVDRFTHHSDKNSGVEKDNSSAGRVLTSMSTVPGGDASRNMGRRRRPGSASMAAARR